MFNQCPRRVREPQPKQLPRVVPNSPSGREERWSPLPEEYTPTSQGKMSLSDKSEPLSILSEDSGKQPCEQGLSNVLSSPRSCATSQNSLPSPLPLDGGPWKSKLEQWQNNVAQAELRVALRYSMGLLMMQALSRRSAFLEAQGESQIG